MTARYRTSKIGVWEDLLRTAITMATSSRDDVRTTCGDVSRCLAVTLALMGLMGRAKAEQSTVATRKEAATASTSDDTVQVKAAEDPAPREGEENDDGTGDRVARARELRRDYGNRNANALAGREPREILLEYHLLLQRDGKDETIRNPDQTEFRQDDRFRISVTPNGGFFLWVLSIPENSDPNKIPIRPNVMFLFPDPDGRFPDERRMVEGQKEVLLPPRRNGEGIVIQSAGLDWVYIIASEEQLDREQIKKVVIDNHQRRSVDGQQPVIAGNAGTKPGEADQLAARARADMRKGRRPENAPVNQETDEQNSFEVRNGMAVMALSPPEVPPLIVAAFRIKSKSSDAP